MRLLKFGTREGLYTFPGQSSGKDNFLSLVTRASRLPGVSGGYDELRDRRADQSIGSVSTQVQLLTSDYQTMREQRDALAALAGWSRGLLFSQTWEDPRQDKRYCVARPDNFDPSENVKERPDLQQKWPLVFQVSDPGWRGGQKPIFMDDHVYFDDGWYYEGAIYFDEGYTFDSGVYFNPPKLDQQMFHGDTATVTNRGNRRAVARLTISATEPEWAFGGETRFGDGHYFDGGAPSSSNFRVRWTANGKLETDWTWGDTLLPGEFLIVDGETQSIKVRGRTDRSGFTAFQRHRGLGFISVPPGDSTLQITGGIGARGARVVLEFRDTFYSN